MTKTMMEMVKMTTVPARMNEDNVDDGGDNDDEVRLCDNFRAAMFVELRSFFASAFHYEVEIFLSF